MVKYENKNEVENIKKEAEKLMNDADLELVNGSFLGSDWNKKDAGIYRKLGITHKRNVFKRDKYYVGGLKLPNSFVDTILYRYKYGNKSTMQTIQSLMENLQKCQDVSNYETIYEYFNTQF